MPDLQGADLLGTTLSGRYTIEGELGRGGMATVRHQRPAETPLFKVLWFTLRGGVFQTLGL